MGRRSRPLYGANIKRRKNPYRVLNGFYKWSRPPILKPASCNSPALADLIGARAAVQRGRMVNRVFGEPSSELPERHEAGDFATKTWDKLAPGN